MTFSTFPLPEPSTDPAEIDRAIEAARDRASAIAQKLYANVTAQANGTARTMDLVQRRLVAPIDRAINGVVDRALDVQANLRARVQDQVAQANAVAQQIQAKLGTGMVCPPGMTRTATSGGACVPVAGLLRAGGSAAGGGGPGGGAGGGGLVTKPCVTQGGTVQSSCQPSAMGTAYGRDAQGNLYVVCVMSKPGTGDPSIMDLNGQPFNPPAFPLRGPFPGNDWYSAGNAARSITSAEIDAKCDCQVFCYWYCIPDPHGGPGQVVLLSGNDPPPPNSTGPYPDKQTALNYCGGGGGNGNGGGPPPVYGCTDPAAGNYNPDATVDDGSCTYSGGGGGGGGGGGLCDPTDPTCCPQCNCQPCVCTPCPPVQPPPTFTSCPAIGTISLSLAPIGTAQWCSDVAANYQSITQLGQQFLSWLSDVFTANGTALQDFSLKPDASWGPIVSAVATVIQAGVNALGVIESAIGDWLNGVLQCWQSLSQISGACDPTGLVALGVLRGFVRWFRDVRLGSPDFMGISLRLDVLVDQVDRVLSYLIEYVCPSKLPSVDEVYAAWIPGIISDDYARCMLQLHGYSDTTLQPFRQARGVRLTIDQVIRYYRLQGADDSQVDSAVKAHYWTDDQDRQAAISLYDRPPSPQEVVGWTGSGALDGGVVGTFGLDDGFSDWWSTWGDSTLKPQGITQDLARRLYTAARRPLSVGDAREALHRLRPGSPLPAPVFDLADYQAALRATGMSDLSVQWAAALAYRALSPADVMQLGRDTGVDRATLSGAYQDAGYSPEDADRLAQNGVEDVARAQARAGMVPTLTEAAEWVRVGIMDRDNAYNALGGQGYTPDQFDGAINVQVARYQFSIRQRGQAQARMRTVRAVQTAYQTGTIDGGSALSVLQQTGMDSSSAQAILADMDLAERTALAKLVIGEVEKAFASGEVDAAQALTALTMAGITAERAQGYVAAWQVKQSQKQRALSAGEILRMTREGLIDYGTAAARLGKLGYDANDVGLLLQEQADKAAEAEQRLLAAQEKAREAVARREAAAAERARKQRIAAAKAAAAAAAKLAHQIEQHKRQQIAAWAKNYTLSDLKKWLAAGLIDEGAVRYVLKQEEYTDDAIKLRLAEWAKAAPAWAPDRQPQQPAVP